MQMTAEQIKNYLEGKLKMVQNNKEVENISDNIRNQYIGQEWLLQDILRSIR